MKRIYKKNILINILIILLGNFLLAVAVGVFILPYNILSGGVAGIAVAIEPVIHINKEWVVDGLVVILFIIGWIALGKEFAVKTALSSFAYPIFLSMVSAWLPDMVIDPILASLYGGLLGGIGIGLVMRVGASTGGMDIPPLIINKLTGAKVSSSVLVIDALTVVLGLVTYDLEAVLIGFISVFATSYTIDKILTLGGAVSKSVEIISDKYQEIVEQIHVELNRGTTILDAKGGYTGDQRKVILVVVSQKQYADLIAIIKDYDKEAFVITTDATDMHGEGFSFGFRV